MKRIVPVVLLLCILFSISSCSDSGKTKEKRFFDAFGHSYYAETEKVFTKYEKTKYKVGDGLTSGDYVLFPSSTYGAKYKVTSDEHGFNMLREEYIGDIWTITLKENEYVFLDNCYMVKLEETPSCSSRSFELTQYDGKNVRLKVGYHVPAGEYAFEDDVAVYSDLTQTVEDNTSIKADHGMICFGNGSFATQSSKFTICSISEGEYCKTGSALSVLSKSFIPLSNTAPVDDIKEYGVYKVGLHLPTGSYTVSSTPSYYSAFNLWFYDGLIEVYENNSLIQTIKIEKDEIKQIELYENQIVVFRSIKITHREDS